MITKRDPINCDEHLQIEYEFDIVLVHYYK